MDKKTVTIKPGIGAGPIEIGRHRDSIQESYTYIYSSFFKTQASKFRSDHCELAGFTAHYDSEGNTNYIEIFNDKSHEVEYEIFDAKTQHLTLHKLKKILISKNISFQVNEYGMEAASIGLSTFNHNLQSEEDIIESFGIFSPVQSA